VEEANTVMIHLKRWKDSKIMNKLSVSVRMETKLVRNLSLAVYDLVTGDIFSIRLNE